MAPQLHVEKMLARLYDLDGHILSHLKTVAGLAVIPLLFVAAYQVYKWRMMHPMEPTLVSSKLPFIGPNLALLWKGPAAWLGFHVKKQLPVITLPSLMGNGKMYMVTTPGLVTSMFANRDLHFTPILAMLIAPLVPLPPQALKDFKSGIFTAWVNALPRMLTGDGGRGVLGRIQQSMNEHIDALPAEGLKVDDIGLWLRNVMSRVLMRGLVGDVSFAGDETFINAFWELEWDLDHFNASPAPSVTAPRAYKAREYVIDRMGEWLAAPDQDPDAIDPATGTRRGTLAEVSVALLAIVDEHPHWTARDRGTLLIFVIHVALSNVVQTIFWCFAHIYSDPTLVGQVRAEACAALSSSSSSSAAGGDSSSSAIDGPPAQDERFPARVQGRCPLLTAAFQETQRLITSTPIIRLVGADTTIADGKGGKEYLLRKGAYLFAPRTVVHLDKDVWGDDAEEFRAERFLASQNGGSCSGSGGGEKLAAATAVAGDDRGAGFKSTPRGAFFPFGGGKEVCPGRHMSTSTVVLLLAKVLAELDIQPDEDTPIRNPGSGLTKLTILVWRMPMSTGWRGTLRKAAKQ